MNEHKVQRLLKLLLEDDKSFWRDVKQNGFTKEHSEAMNRAPIGEEDEPDLVAESLQSKPNKEKRK